MAILQNKFVREDGSIIGSSVIISCKYTSEVNSQTNLTVGDTTADEVEVECRVLDKEITAGEKLTYYQIEDGVENLIGVFYAEAPTKATKTSIRFKAYDGKAKLAADFSEWLNSNQDRFPMTLRSLAGIACEVAGLTLAVDSFQFESLSIPAFYADGVTCRQVISWAAQIAGCFVKCNSTGEIGFGWYRNTDTSVTKSDFIQDSLSKKTYSTDLIKRVQFKQETNDVGVIYPADADGNVFSISQNGLAALLDSDTLRTIAEYLYGKLKDLTYTPLSFTMARTALIKTGDIISVTDGNGETVSTYVMKVYLDSSGTQISSTGDQSYADKAAVSSEQYKNIPGKVLTLEKSVDGLRIENKDTAGKLAALELDVDGIEARVSDAEKGLAEIELAPGQVNVTAQKKKILGAAYSFGYDSDGNLVLEYEGEQPEYSIDGSGNLVLEYEGDTPPNTWIDENGVLHSSDDSAMITEFIGTLRSVIDAEGTWEMEFDQNGEITSSIRFDLATRRFVFDGDIVVGDALRDDITTITNDTLSTTNVVAKYLQLSGSININDRFIVDSEGNVTLPDNASISWGQVDDKPSNLATTDYVTSQGYQTSGQVESAITGKGYQTASQVTQITKDTISTTNVVAQYLQLSGSININNRFKVDSSGNVTLPDNASISWTQVSSKPTNLATTDYVTSQGYQTSSQVESAITGKGYQTASQVTQITKDTVTTSYVNALSVKAGSVDAENLTGTTIKGKVLSGVTGDFTGTVTASYLKAVSGGNIAGWTIDNNSMMKGTLGEANSMWLCNTGTTTSATIGNGEGNGWCIAVGKNFGVKNDGTMYCQGADLIGKITATTGEIGGFTISSDNIKSMKSGYGLALYPAGILYNNSTFFVVIYKNGGSQPVGGLTATGWKTITT